MAYVDPPPGHGAAGLVGAWDHENSSQIFALSALSRQDRAGDTGYLKRRDLG